MDLGIIEKTRMQVKCNYDTGRMHIQVLSEGESSRKNRDYGYEGESSRKNRDYGYATKLPCPHGVSDWLRNQDPVFDSAAKTGKNYILVEPLVYEEHKVGGRPIVQLLIHGGEYNHPMGMVLNLSLNKTDAIELVKYLEDVDMLNKMEGEAYYPPQEEGEEE